MKRILVTGGAGFVGSNLAEFLKMKYPSAGIIIFDNLSRQGSEINAARLQDKGIEFIKGDVREKRALLDISGIDAIIECSAEPTVLAGYEDPQYMIDTNLTGAINCLELAKREGADVIFLSTSRVYPISELNSLKYVEKETRFEWVNNIKGIAEDFTLTGVRSLYGATKLAAEHLVLEYMDIYGINAVINRFGVIAGPWQMGKIDQGVVGFWMARHLFGGELKYIGYGGKGKQLRDVLHIEDACRLIEAQMDNWDICRGRIYNAGGGKKNTVSLCELTKKTAELTGKTVSLGKELKERKADIRIYYSDNTCATDALGWAPQKSVDDILLDTRKWMEEYAQILQPVLGV